MDDSHEGGSRSSKLGTRVREAASQVRRRGAMSIRGVRHSVGEVGDRLKSSEASKQMGSAVESWRVIKKAADAQRRGNHAMAYRLLEPKVREKPSDARLVVAFWTAARACDRAEDAVSFVTQTIRRLASSGKPDRAAELWMELRNAVPSARVDPSSLVRIAEALAVRGEADSPAQALRDAADSDPKGLSPGLAVRIAEMAREFDPPTALRAARRALEAPDLHTAKRARLQQLVEELTADGPGTGPSLPAEAPATSPRPSTTSLAASDELGELEAATTDCPLNGPDAGLDRIVERELGAELESGAEAMEIKPVAELEALAPTSRFRDLKSREAMPTGLLTEAVALQVAAGRTARIAYTRIEAIAVAEVTGLARYPVVVIDLLLNWSSQRDRTLRSIRLRSDGFDPRMVFEAPADRDEALRGFLSELLARCNAVPLPDLASIRGLDVRAFETVEAYARDVLQVES